PPDPPAPLAMLPAQTDVAAEAIDMPKFNHLPFEDVELAPIDAKTAVNPEATEDRLFIVRMLAPIAFV
ncbi:hypothetical protein DJ537_25935, partial [Enterobacter hormaechei]|uniref:hypothetical protein n=1 Tax=Enterobacter hormaechei TaxID=158836 RepID=UPI0011E43ACB